MLSCRKCSVCEGETHHWLEECDEKGEPVLVCKHCGVMAEYPEEQPIDCTETYAAFAASEVIRTAIALAQWSMKPGMEDILDSGEFVPIPPGLYIAVIEAVDRYKVSDWKIKP